MRVASLLDAAREAFLPGLCCCCASVLPGGDRGLCAACWSRVSPLGSDHCPLCGGESEPADEPCLQCTESPPPQRGTVVWGEHDGVLRTAILAAKHHGRDDLIRPLASRLAARVSLEPWSGSLSVVTAVPSHPVHRLRRPFAMAPLLAAGVARDLGLPHRRVLARRGVRRQARRTRRDRLRLPRRSFVARRAAPHGQVLLIDDVTTTGATLRRAASALLLAGADTVYCAVLARARDPRRLP